MRIAVVADIHGNLTAFEAVLADLRQTSPDVVLHGGDLADAGSSPVEIVDRIREFGWPGIMGNTDELLFRPESLQEFAAQSSPNLKSLFSTVEEMAAFTRESLGNHRLDWLRALPRVQKYESIAVVHASPPSLWRAPLPEATDQELETAFSPLEQRTVVYAHIHRPFTRSVNGMTIGNAGSVSLPYDGDPRASYLLIDDDQVTIKRVAYDIAKEQRALTASKLPHADWIARSLETARPQMP